MAGTEKKAFQWENMAVKVSKDFRVEGELALNPESPPIERIVHYGLEIEDLQMEEAAGGLTVQGKIAPRLIFSGLNIEGNAGEGASYFSAEPGGFPFTYRMDLGSMPANSRWEASCRIKRGAVERQLHHSIRLEADLEVTVAAWQKEQVELIAENRIASPHWQIKKETVSSEMLIGSFKGAALIQSLFDIPYSKSPLARILKTLAIPTGIRVEARDGRIRLEGNLGVSLTYVGSEDDGREGQVEMADWGGDNPISWQIEIDAAKVNEDSLVVPRISVNLLKVDQRGGEGIRLEAEIQAEVQAYKAVQDEIMTDIHAQDGIIDVDRRNVNLTHIVDNRVIPLSIDRVFDIPTGMPEIGRIVAYHADMGGLSAECAGGKVLADGEVNLNLTYAAADEDRFPGLYAVTMGDASGAAVWSESIEFPDADEGMQAEVAGGIVGASVETADGHRIRLKADAFLKIKVVEVKSFSVVMDFAEIPAVLSAPRPSMVFYLTQPGDTLWKIARKYQTTMDALARENHLSPEEALPINKRLIIPTVSSGRVTVLR